MSDPDPVTTPVEGVAETPPKMKVASNEGSSNTGGPNANTKPDRTDQSDKFSLKVKAEYIITGRAPSLGALPPEADEPQDDRDGDNNTKKKKKKRKGMNKKRPRDKKQSFAEKICMSTIRDEICPYGEKCKFSHDLKAFMATRPADIKEVEGGCPIYNSLGYCVYGATCRLGSSHISKTGDNLNKHPSSIPGEMPQQPLPDNAINVLPKEIQTQLRKKKYPFKCKRYCEKTERKSNSTGEAKDEEMQVNALSEPSSSTPVELKTRKIIDFSNKIYIAPLTTVGNLPFRRIMKKFGADITCGEMAVGTNLLEGRTSEWALLKRHPDEDVFGVQIAAAHPDQYTRVAELLEKHTNVDFVDLNLGCPLDLICSKGAGAALMMRDRKLKASLEGMSGALSCPITIKIRTGWDMTKPFAHQLVPKIQSWNIDGVAAIMLHGRSRLQRYQRLANWDYISEAAAGQSNDFTKIPIIGNGDIFCYTDYEEKIARQGVSKTAMLARGALIKPWLPTEIKERRHWDISAPERLDILKEFVRFGLEHWGSDQQGVNNTRRFLLEWLSFLHRYVPVGLLEVVPQQMNQRPPNHMLGRNDLETLFLSAHSSDWIKISEMLLGPVPDDFKFQPKHKAKGYA